MWAVSAVLRKEMGLRYYCVAHSIYVVALERKREKSDDDSLVVSRMEVCCCTTYLERNLVRYLMDD